MAKLKVTHFEMELDQGESLGGILNTIVGLLRGTSPAAPASLPGAPPPVPEITHQAPDEVEPVEDLDDVGDDVTVDDPEEVIPPPAARPERQRRRPSAPVPAAAAPGPVMVTAVEKPGETFTLAQAVKLSGVSEVAVRQCCVPSGIRKNKSAGGFHWRFVESPAAPSPAVEHKPQHNGGEARSRFGDEVMPINPGRIQSSEPKPRT